MTTLSQTDLDNAMRDAQDLGKFVNDASGTVATRTGGTIPNLNSLIDTIEALPAAVVSGPASSVSGNVPTFNGTTGKLLQDGGFAYAAGTFTPTVTLNGAGTVPVYSTNTGRYTRIGRQVFVDVLLTGDGGNEGSGAGLINVALPFAASASFPLEKFLVGTARNSAAEYIVVGEVPTSGASTIQLLYSDAITNQTGFTGAQQDNANRFIRLKFAYEV